MLPGSAPTSCPFIKSFDLFVMSSVTEGLGTSLLDAMAASKAIVATRTGGIPEVVVDGETGLLVPPRDATALAAAIVAAAERRRAAARMGEAGLARVQRAVHRRADGRGDAGRVPDAATRSAGSRRSRLGGLKAQPCRWLPAAGGIPRRRRRGRQWPASGHCASPWRG